MEPEPLLLKCTTTFLVDGNGYKIKECYLQKLNNDDAHEEYNVTVHMIITVLNQFLIILFLFGSHFSIQLYSYYGSIHKNYLVYIQGVPKLCTHTLTDD